MKTNHIKKSGLYFITFSVSIILSGFIGPGTKMMSWTSVNTVYEKENKVNITGNCISDRKARGDNDSPEELRIESVKLAIQDLIDTYGDKYPKGETYMEELDRQYETYINSRDNITKARAAIALFRLRHEALCSNPLISGNPVLYIAKHQYVMDHSHTHTVYNTGIWDYNGPQGAAPTRKDIFIPGAALKIIDLKNGGKITTLVEAPEGWIRDPDVHWDGKKVVFSMKKNRDDNHHIYEINMDGSGLKQLTHLKDIDDVHVMYLPDNDIAFSSTRELKYLGCNRHRQFNIYRMGPDGSNIHQITKSIQMDQARSITPDGRIIYDRYYYVDRNSHNVKSVWTVNPDGTNADQYWGNHTLSPDAVIMTRVIPGTQQAVTIFGSMHDRPRGAMAIIDRRLGMDGPKPVIKIWPGDAIDHVKGPQWCNEAEVFARHMTGWIVTGNELSGDGYYQDPYPLNEKYFLVSKRVNKLECLYLVDIYGNEILLHKEESGCFNPMPLKSRERPVVRPVLRDYENKEGCFYVQDVYQGLGDYEGMRDIPRGTVKYLRVVEAPEKRYWASGSLVWGNYSWSYPGVSWHGFETKRILGTVPVEEDGSAYLEVPSEKFVFFQLLDEKKQMIQSMRSGVSVQSGEIKGCIGCHDNRLRSPIQRGSPVLQALGKPPKTLDGWYGEAREFNYTAEVQPVLDRHCVMCHDFGTKAGEKLNLARDRNLIFNTSYNELWRKGYVIGVGAGGTKIPPPYFWGSHASPLIKTLNEGHQGIELTKEEFERLVTWLDMNAPFYGSYACAYPENRGGRSPLSPDEEDRLSELTGINVEKQFAHQTNQGPLVSFDRPVISPVLSGLKLGDKKYEEALSIIEKGKERFRKNPPADMPGFKITQENNPADVWHEETYQYLRWIEMRNRQAIREGGKIYDTDQPTFDEWHTEKFSFSE